MSEVASASTASTVTELRQGLLLGRSRLWRRPALLIALLACSLGLTFGLIEGRSAPVGAADRALAAMFRLVVPLTSFAIVSLMTGRGRLGESVWCVARFGLRRRTVALGLQLAAMLAASLVAVAGVELTLVAAHLGGDPTALARDALVSGWIAALGAAAYVAWFSLGSSWLRLGRGRWVPLLLDFTLGLGSGYVAIAWPRCHLQNLIGGLAPLELPQSSSSAVLLALVIVLTLAASLRCGD